MRAHRMLAPVLALVVAAPAAGQQVPPALRNLRPHQIVEAVAAEWQTLNLTPVQQGQFDSLHAAIRTEPHRYVGAPVPGKAHENFRMRPMVSRQQAYGNALAILTPDQRVRAAARFAAADYRVPVELRPRPAARSAGTDPLQHHTAGIGPLSQSSRSADPDQDPLQHHFGKAPTVQGTTGASADPMTHRE